jgi:carboxylesterase
MLDRAFAYLRREFVALEGTSQGRLKGQGNPAAIGFEGSPGRGGILALHGFAGTPNEVRLLLEAGRRVGMAGSAPLLPGHGTHARDLQHRSLSEWLAAAEASFEELYRRVQAPIVVGGLSLGALLAIQLAATRKDRVCGLVAVSTALKISPLWPGLPLRFLERLPIHGNEFYLPKPSSDIRDPEGLRRHMTYDANPMRAAVQVLRAARTAESLLPFVRCPTLIVHGSLDRVCPASYVHTMAQSLGSSDVEVALMPASGHILTADFDREEAARRIELFLGRVAPSEPAVPAAAV